ncbi:MAG: hypothetical protein ACRDPA_02870, partial [Solirubrobacteraceae bacterium]
MFARRDAVYAGQYSAVLYDCANDSVAHWISRLAAKVRLTRSEFTVVVQAPAEEIRTLAPAPDNDVAPASSSDTTRCPRPRSMSNPLRGFPQCILRLAEAGPRDAWGGGGAGASLSRDLRNPGGEAATPVAPITDLVARDDVITLACSARRRPTGVGWGGAVRRRTALPAKRVRDANTQTRQWRC